MSMRRHLRRRQLTKGRLTWFGEQIGEWSGEGLGEPEGATSPAVGDRRTSCRASANRASSPRRVIFSCRAPRNVLVGARPWVGTLYRVTRTTLMRVPMGSHSGPDGDVPGILRPRTIPRAFRHRASPILVLALLAWLAAACSSPGPNASPPSSTTTTPIPSSSPTTTTTNPLTATDAAILAGWRAAENAFYRASASPTGLTAAALPATMVNPELLLVKRGLAGDEHDGFIGRGPWDLGSPEVAAFDPSSGNPSTATVKSCIHDSQIVVNQQTGQPAPGLAGVSDWAGATSTMVLSDGIWKLSKQSAVAASTKEAACAGLGS